MSGTEGCSTCLSATYSGGESRQQDNVGKYDTEELLLVIII